MSATNRKQAIRFDVDGAVFQIFLKRTPSVFGILGIHPDKRTDADYEKIIDEIRIDDEVQAFAELGNADYIIVTGQVFAFLARWGLRTDSGRGSRNLMVV